MDFPRSPSLRIRSEGASLIEESQGGSVLENWEPTIEGTLRSVVGPSPWLHCFNAQGGTPTGEALGYGTPRGLFHARIGTRDFLLLHEDDTIKVFKGMYAEAGAAWRTLLGPNTTPAAHLGDSGGVTPPTLFVQAPNGVVIVPPRYSRAYFFDGSNVFPLGFDRAPGPPDCRAPQSTTSERAKVADSGYVHPGHTMHDDFKNGRLGTIRGPGSPTTASAEVQVLEAGEYQGALQWVDMWGNLSPVSPRSATVSLPYQETAATTAEMAEGLRHQLYWEGILPGPPGTTGRILLRTKDMAHSGTAKLFEVPHNMSGGGMSFSTVPDNISSSFPDNVPDASLLLEAQDIVPVPHFSAATVSNGRLVIANIRENGGKVMWSLPGKWGTFGRFDFAYVDSVGTRIEAVHTVAEGVLVLTRGSTHLVDITGGGAPVTLSSAVGCVAPASIQTLPNGMTVWLGARGFFGYLEGRVVFLGAQVEYATRWINKTAAPRACSTVDERTGQYMCWVPYGGSQTNTMCFTFDGANWRRRTDVEAVAACAIKSGAPKTLVAGYAKGNFKVDASVQTGFARQAGVWVLDHQDRSFENSPLEAVLETGWLGVSSGDRKKTTSRVILWMRSTTQNTASVEVYRDFDDANQETTTSHLVPPDDVPGIYGKTKWGASVWRRRAPFWQKVDIYVPSASVFKLKLRSTEDMEFVALAVESTQRGEGGRLVWAGGTPGDPP